MNGKGLIVNGRRIGPDHPPYIIAEMSGNHNHDLKRALDLLQAAKAAGADAVKLQTYTADTMTIDHNGDDFQISTGPWAGWKLYDLYREAHTPWDWHPALFARARELEMTIFSTPFDSTAVDFLEELATPAYKIASFEITDLPLIRKVAGTGKPMIISTGMASLAEIAEAVDAAREGGANGIVLLHCISAYPAPVDECNLRTIPHLAAAFDVLAGLSDHTLGVGVSVAAAVLGAAVIEKHFTLARADGGVDSAFSLEPEELKALVDNTRVAHAALVRVNYHLVPSEKSSKVFRRSLYVVENVREGEELSERNVRAIRPGFGLPPKHMTSVVGKRAMRDLYRGEPLSFEMVGE